MGWYGGAEGLRFITLIEGGIALDGFAQRAGLGGGGRGAPAQADLPRGRGQRAVAGPR